MQRAASLFIIKVWFELRVALIIHETVAMVREKVVMPTDNKMERLPCLIWMSVA